MSIAFKKLPTTALLCALFILFSNGLNAQHQLKFVSSKPVNNGNEIADLIKSGEKLEQQGQWGDALTLYERGQKEFGKSKQLDQRLFRARTHYDVNRRIRNSSYLRSVRGITSETASNILAEVLLKIETHYVNQPSWVALARQGLANMDVALYSAEFNKAFPNQRSKESIDRAYRGIHDLAQKFRVGSRLDLYHFADKVSVLVQQETGIPRRVTVFEFINGAVASLDPYSSFLTGQEYADVMSQIDGNIVGLGVEIRPTKDQLRIMAVIPNGPAAKSGLQDGDQIISIDGKQVSVIGGNAAADLLRGPEGSRVGLKIRRDGVNVAYQITRRRVDIPSLQNVRIVDARNGIAYIKLANFQKTTAREFDNALWHLHREGMRSLIVDVRGNPGGLLTAAVDVADLFIDQGVLVSTKGRNARENFVHRARVEGTWKNLPLTVLVDRDSASASEIFAGAINDQKRGTIVGEKSYGKGSVQGIFPLNIARGGIRLTTAKFYSPSGKAISDHGVTPDVQVQTVLKPSFDLVSESSGSADTPGDDKALRSAITVATQQLTRKAG